MIQLQSTEKNSEFDQEIPQSQTADKPKSNTTITRHHEDKLSNFCNEMSLPHHDDFKTRMDTK